MPIYIDKKYINLISNSLDKFKWKKDTLANCRCPICGDSSKNKVKARGYFYCKGNDFFYRCHNCNFGTNLYNFLEKISPVYCKEYALERWKNGENGNSNYKKPNIEISFETKEKLNTNVLSLLPKVSSLSENHPCKIYVKKRLIPEKYYDILLYSDDFGKLQKLENKTENDKRLIIPVYDENNELISYQGRSITNSNVKYITQHLTNDSSWFGINQISKIGEIFVFEGPIDSMFIPNSVATLGLGNWSKIPNIISDRKLIYVLDNEPRNKEVVKTMLDICNNGKRLCIWPENVNHKDINEMILVGYKPDKIKQIILENTCSGPFCLFKITQWRRCNV